MSNYIDSVNCSGTGSGLLSKLVSTHGSWGSVILRLGLAIMMWPHGAQKLLGWFGGFGFAGTMDFLTQSMPTPVAFLVILGEFFAPILLFTGFLTRIAAASIAVIMLGAIFMVHLPNGFFAGDNGFEMHLLVITIAIALVVQGAGSASVDLKLSNK